LQSEYPKYTPLFAKILECVLQESTSDDKISHHKEVTDIDCLFMLYCICLELLVLMTMDKGAAFI
jgi:hypothetical protein